MTGLYHAYAFIDGGYFRALCQEAGTPLADPQILAAQLISSEGIQSWGRTHHSERLVSMARVLYYDAAPEGAEPSELKAYWDEVELLRDTELRFGVLRGRRAKAPRRQKGVDTLLAVDMVVGAFTGLYRVGLLVAGDADFVPVVDEVRRRGAMVALVGHPDSVADELRRVADRFIPIGKGFQPGFSSLKVGRSEGSS